MALWGDYAGATSSSAPYGISTAGTLTVDYAAKTITGVGVSFYTGVATNSYGYLKAGDVVRFGLRGLGEAYFGDAVVSGITSTTVASIAHTSGLSGGAISGVNWQASTLAKWTPTDSSFSERFESSAGIQTFYNAIADFSVATTNATGAGSSVINIDEVSFDDGGIVAGDFVNISDTFYEVEAVGEAWTSNSDSVSAGGTVIRTPGLNGLGVGDYLSGHPGPIASVGSTVATVTTTAVVGNSTIIFNVVGTLPFIGDTVTYPTSQADGTIDAVYAGGIGVAASMSAELTAGVAVTITSGASTPEIFCLKEAVATTIAADATLKWVGDKYDGWVSLSSTITDAITQGDTLAFSRYNGGKDTYIYGISTTGTQNALGTVNEVANPGWIGVTTYTDNQGNLRVKSEVLASLSGIQTGNVPIFPPTIPPNA